MPVKPTKVPEPPAHLSPTAQALWSTLTEDWTFHAAERSVLRGGLEAMDLAERARRELAEVKSLTLETGAGMSRVNPLVKVFLDASKEARMAFQCLKLEMPDDTAASWRSYVGGGNR
jgi:phage terminase small subunit